MRVVELEISNKHQSGGSNKENPKKVAKILQKKVFFKKNQDLFWAFFHWTKSDGCIFYCAIFY